MRVIGITTYGVNEQGDIPLPHQYVDSVRRAGGTPVLIPPGEPKIEELAAQFAGIILTGGGDICPSRYDGPSHETVYMVNAQRDETELQLARELLARRIPTLAICRGLQIVNVALGGSLHVHLPDVVGEQLEHRAPPRNPTPHPIRIESNSKLARVMKTTTTDCMSWHHQAVDRLAHGCRAVAFAEDGVVEAIEVDDHPELLAVQWHPELSSDTNPAQQRLFDGLLRMIS